jgi:hypothetical protein
MGQFKNFPLHGFAKTLVAAPDESLSHRRRELARMLSTSAKKDVQSRQVLIIQSMIDHGIDSGSQKFGASL